MHSATVRSESRFGSEKGGPQNNDGFLRVHRVSFVLSAIGVEGSLSRVSNPKALSIGLQAGANSSSAAEDGDRHCGHPQEYCCKDADASCEVVKFGDAVGD